MRREVALVARAARGARNAFAVLAGALEAAGLLGKGVRMYVTEDDPLPHALRLEEKGLRVAVLYGVASHSFVDLAGELEAVASRYPVMVGGPHAEAAYWQVLRLGAKAAVVGDGEAAVVGFAKYVMGEADLKDVPNIAYRDGERFRVSRIDVVDLDSYPAYSRTLSLYPPIEIMRGCLYSCKFCQVPWMFKKQVRFRSVERVVEAAEAYVRAGIRRIRFVAPIGFAYMSTKPGEPNVDAIERLLKGVRGVGGEPYLGTFPSEARPEYVTREVLEVVKRYAANRRVAIGLQSGDERVLALSLRGHGVEEVLEAVKLTVSMGLGAVVDMIFGMPGEDEEAVKRTVEVMFKLARMGARLRLHTFMPLPGTPFARQRPRPIHPAYRAAVRKLIGKGVIEGDWEEQERLAVKIYCTTAADPAPTPHPKPLAGDEGLCRGVWRHMERTTNAYRGALGVSSGGL
ncbi:MAG: TIGR04013 family B12-binding domain/radical SAM domain-containing protein [Thermoproteota archaeon]